MKVYLDNCCYNRPYDDQSQIKVFLETQAKLHIQRLIIEGKIELVYSYMSRYENSQNPFEIRKNTIENFFKNATVYVDESRADNVVQKARQIMSTRIKEKDAIHVACAIIAGADYFLTTDMRLLKYKTDEIKLINPTEFIIELEV